MLKFIKGNIFESDSKALINPVNTDGVMGKGLAYQFKQKYPENFKYYKEMCDSKEFYMGSDLLFFEENEKIIINFPTKKTWRENSKIEYIDIGLLKLKELIKDKNIKSIAIPPLGAGNGKLDWNLVKERLEILSKEIQSYGCDINIYEPTLSETKLGKAHLYLVLFLTQMKKKDLTIYKSDLIFQKLMYLYDLISKKNYFKFYKYTKGPFSKFLNVAYGELKNYSRTSGKNLENIKDDLLKKNITKDLEQEEKFIFKTLNFYKEIQLNYFEEKNKVEDKIELITTLLFIINEKKEISQENLFQELTNWNKRKKDKYIYSDVEEVINFLIEKNVLKKDMLELISLKKEKETIAKENSSQINLF